MTEEEAKTKWCPLGRVVATRDDRVSYAVAFNRATKTENGEHSLATLCIASACMAWRWAGTASQYVKAEYVPGYCGLAGSGQ